MSISKKEAKRIKEHNAKIRKTKPSKHEGKRGGKDKALRAFYKSETRSRKASNTRDHVMGATGGLTSGVARGIDSKAYGVKVKRGNPMENLPLNTWLKSNVIVKKKRYKVRSEK